MFIMVLCFSLGACATSTGAQGEGDLLSWTDLASEITVGFEERAEKPPADIEIDGPLGTP
jgi:hypothetical protein